jgi:RNA polymerase sigma-70 factor (ECF subfamily)
MASEVNSSAQRMVDADIVRRAQQGDVDAFAALFHANRTKIYSLCLRMTSNTAEAEDLTQEAFLLAFRKLGTFRGDSALSTWLYRVAVNTVLMHFRKRGMRVREASLDEIQDQDTRVPKPEPGEVDERLASATDRIALTRAITVLSPGYRTVFLMHEVHGYEHEEIARILRCSIGNSKSQLHKAKRRMREMLSFRKSQPGAQHVLREPMQTTSRRARVAPDYGCGAVGQPAWAAPNEMAA